jgi:hypothetical protein
MKKETYYIDLLARIQKLSHSLHLKIQKYNFCGSKKHTRLPILDNEIEKKEEKSRRYGVVCC